VKIKEFFTYQCNYKPTPESESLRKGTIRGAWNAIAISIIFGGTIFLFIKLIQWIF